MGMKQQWDHTAREIARLVVEVMPYLNERRIANRLYEYFSGERGPSYEDNHFYFVENLKEILENAFTDVLPEDEDGMAAASDVRWAFDQLSVAYQYRIEERYRWGVIHPTDSPERAQLNRAIRKMCDILNGWNMWAEYEGPGSRKVWSNARARAEIDHDYNDDGNKGYSTFDPGQWSS